MVVPEASFPDRISVPWSVAPVRAPWPPCERGHSSDAAWGAVGLGDRADATGDAGRAHGARPDRSPITMPVETLPLPLLLLGGDPGDDPARDEDAEVGATPDTLRSLGCMSGDVVAITATLGDATRIGRLVAAERWISRANGGGGGVEGRGDAGERTESTRLSPGVLYLPPGMMRNLHLHLQTGAMATANQWTSPGARPDRATEPTEQSPETDHTHDAGTPRTRPRVVVARVPSWNPGGGASILASSAAGGRARAQPLPPIRRAASVAVAPVRTPAPLLPRLPPAVDPWSPGGRAECALGEYFARTRLLAPGDVFGVVMEAPADGGGYLGTDGGGGGDAGWEGRTAVRTRREVLYFVVASMTPEASRGSGGCKGRRRRASAGETDVLQVSREWTACTLLGPAAAGGPPPGLERFVLRGDVRGGSSPAPLAPPATAAVTAALAPPLHPAASASLRLRTAVLLHGPAGAGKRAAAAAAAATLGATFVSVSCHELIAEAGETKLAGVIGSSFGAAAMHAPAVLYLRRFGALAGAAAAAGGAGGAGGSAGEIARGGSGATSAVSQALNRAISSHTAWAAESATATQTCCGGRGANRGDGGMMRDRGDDEDEVEAERSLLLQRKSGGSAAGGGGASGKTGEGRGGKSSGDEGAVVLVAGVEDLSSLPESLRQCFTHEIKVSPPSEPERLATLRVCLGPGSTHEANTQGNSAEDGAGDGFSPDDLAAAAAATSGALSRDVRALAAHASAAAAAAAPSHTTAPRVTAKHISAAVKWSEKRTASAIGTPSVPSVQWDDIGGLEDVKSVIRDIIELPLKRGDLFGGGGGSGRSGALLYGPPGTGKTLLAKAVATECALRFLSVKGPELVNMYVGESERNVREVFERARNAAPCVVFFDELDALAPARGAGADSGGVMDRVVSQLLAELDGAHGAGTGGAGLISSGGADDSRRRLLFVIGATNRPDLVDPALLRPGRFDRLLYVGIDDTPAGRLRVLVALTKNFTLEQGLDGDGSRSGARDAKQAGWTLDGLAGRIPGRFTGADMYALCADAWMRAAKRTLASSADLAEGASATVVVRGVDFADALAHLTPSLTDKDVAHYSKLRENFEGGRGGRRK